MKKRSSIKEYLQDHPEYEVEITTLIQLVRSFSDFKETIKWSFPVYTVQNKNVVGIGAFKSYVGLWFFNGSFINDKYGMLINAEEGKTKAQRQMRFKDLSEIEQNRDIILDYCNQAIENQKMGLTIKPEKKKDLEIPEILQLELNNDVKLKQGFEAMTNFKKREYCEHIADAKREATKQARLKKAISMIRQGIGLHDKYRNC